MPKFSKTSQYKLLIAEKPLILLFDDAIKIIDITILYSHRTAEEQFELFKKGRRLIQENLTNDPQNYKIYDKKKVVTYKDGYFKLSKHNTFPSEAIDFAPYPINFKDTKRIHYFAGIIKGIWESKFANYFPDIDLIWGGDWDNDTDLRDQNFNDLLHFQINYK
jgi:peptidoglycan L-alanyl-D-glutamate endopeptidase CwlK